MNDKWTDQHLSREPVDLSVWDEDYIKAEVKSEFDEIPDGAYAISIHRVEITVSKTSGKPMLKWTLRILDGDYEGRLIWRYNMLASAENVAWLKRDLYKCGLTIDRLSDLEANLPKLLDLKMNVSKKTKEDFTNIYFGKPVVVLEEPKTAEEPPFATKICKEPPIPF